MTIVDPRPLDPLLAPQVPGTHELVLRMTEGERTAFGEPCRIKVEVR